jgi:hydrogenase maturation protease
VIKAADAPRRVLVAGVGNIFLGDDGFGSEVARRLAGRSLPEHVRVVDYGIGGIHLAYDLLDGYDLLVLVDTVPRGEVPGTVTVLEVPDDGAADPAHGAAPGGGVPDSHSLDPAAVLASVRRLGGRMPRTLVVGCEPAATDEGIGLSEAVHDAVEPAARAVRDLVQELDDVATGVVENA